MGQNGQDKSMSLKLNMVADYAWNGSICRRETLAKCTLVRESYEVSCKAFGITLCDNCCQAKQQPKPGYVTNLIKFLIHMKEMFLKKGSDFVEEHDKRKESAAWHRLAREIAALSKIDNEKEFISSLLVGGQDCSMLHALLSYLNDTFQRNVSVMQREVKTRSNLINDLIKRVHNGRIRGFQRRAPLPLSLCREEATASAKLDESKPTSMDSLDQFLKEVGGEERVSPLVQYALPQLEQLSLSDVGGYYTVEKDIALEKVARRTLSDKWPNFELLLDAEKESNGLYWTASVESNRGNIVLNPPELAPGCRIFRKFGAGRFLTVRVKKEIDSSVVKELFGGDGVSKECRRSLFHRSYKYLWCIRDEDPQKFVLFAEEGPGLTPIKVERVLQWAIPQELNADLTIAKRLKRLKLVFSTTTPGARLPDDSVVILPDFEHDTKFVQLDGCGLVSQEALDMIWKAYQEQLPRDQQNSSPCPFSGFQGRLGGLKGTWVLDRSLGPRVVVHCRRTQHKFNVFQTCVQQRGTCVKQSFSPGIFWDDHNVMEINSWDHKPAPATLNTTIIQQLEHLGVPWGFFEEKCLNPVSKDLDILAGSGEESRLAWVRHLHDRQRNSILKEETDSRRCLQMMRAGVGQLDPEIRRLKKRLVRKLFQSLLEKAHYPMDGCVYLRMYGDHTLLLEDGEAFVACDDLDSSAKEIIAMRSPSYFAGDLRRLSLVSLNDVKDRALQKRNYSNLAPELERNAEETRDLFGRKCECGFCTF